MRSRGGLVGTLESLGHPRAAYRRTRSRQGGVRGSPSLPLLRFVPTHTHTRAGIFAAKATWLFACKQAPVWGSSQEGGWHFWAFAASFVSLYRAPCICDAMRPDPRLAPCTHAFSQQPYVPHPHLESNQNRKSINKRHIIMASAAKSATPTGGRLVFLAWAIHLYAWFFGRWVQFIGVYAGSAVGCADVHVCGAPLGRTACQPRRRGAADEHAHRRAWNIRRCKAYWRGGINKTSF